MKTFKVYLSHGQIEVAEDTAVIKGEAHFYTAEGNRHTVWAPQTSIEVQYNADRIAALGETPAGLAMHPDDYAWLQLDYGLADLFDDPLDAKKPVCECGSAKAKLPTHSSWCPMVTK